MAKPTTTASATAAALADAFAELTVEGAPVTVRALRERARVSTDSAAAWLRTNRPARDVPDMPADALASVLDPLWSAAVSAARDEAAETAATERAALIAAEADALAEAQTAVTRAETAEAQLAELRRDVQTLTDRLAAAEASRDQHEAAAAAAGAAAEAARVHDHAEDLRAADATATARTLRDILDTYTPRNRDGRPASSGSSNS